MKKITYWVIYITVLLLVLDHYCASGCEDENIHLSCPVGKVINPKVAMYRRRCRVRLSCIICPQPPDWSIFCHHMVTDEWNDLLTSCEGKLNCTFPVTIRELNDSSSCSCDNSCWSDQRWKTSLTGIMWQCISGEEQKSAKLIVAYLFW